MKKITLLLAIFGLVIGVLKLNAQTVILDHTFDATYAASTANGKTAWTANVTMIATDYADGFGFINATAWSATRVSPCSWAQGWLTLGSPQNANTEDDVWFTYTASGLTIGNSYKVDMPVTRVQGRVDVGHTLDAWEPGSEPSITTDYAVTNSIYTTTTGASEPLQNLTKTFTATSTTMTFGLGIGRVASNLFNKTRITSMTITDLGVLSVEDNASIKNSFTVSKTGVALTNVSGNVQITDLLGRTLASEKLIGQETFNYAFKSATIYLVTLITDSGSATKKVVFE